METSVEIWDRLDAGRHALDEEAGLTPIFAALTRGGWRRQQRETERFRHDPLTAPLPVLRPEPVLAGSGGGAARGRHHRAVA